MTSDSRSGVERQAQVKTSLSFGHHLAVDAADVVLLAVLGVEDDAEAPADAHVGLGASVTAPESGPNQRVSFCGSVQAA